MPLLEDLQIVNVLFERRWDSVNLRYLRRMYLTGLSNTKERIIVYIRYFVSLVLSLSSDNGSPSRDEHATIAIEIDSLWSTCCQVRNTNVNTDGPASGYAGTTR